MAVINTAGKTTTTITDLQVGDVFEFVRAAGCRKVGELLVVKSIDTALPRVSFFGHQGGNYGTTVWLQDKMDAGELIYRPHKPV